MTNEDFLAIIAKSNKKRIVIGIVILAIGLLFAVALAAGGAKGVNTAGMVIIYVMIGLCLLLGFTSIMMSAKSTSQIKNGKHPLAQAILMGDTSYVLWVYEYVTQVKGGGSDHQIWICDRNNKNIIIAARKNNAHEVLRFLSEKFPQAIVGYSKENEKLYKERVAK